MATKTMDAFLGVQYKLESSENFDEYMKAIGMGMMARKLANSASPVVCLKKEGDMYVLSSSSTVKNTVIKFKPGVEFDQDTADGRKVKSTITVDGQTLHEIQKDQSGKTTTIDRIFSEKDLKVVMKIDDLQAARLYKAM